MVSINDLIGNYAYANKALCIEWNNNIPLKELEDNHELLLLLNSQDIQSICEYFPVLPENDITGILASAEDGDYKEVYITEYSMPMIYLLYIIRLIIISNTERINCNERIRFNRNIPIHNRRYTT